MNNFRCTWVLVEFVFYCKGVTSHVWLQVQGSQWFRFSCSNPSSQEKGFLNDARALDGMARNEEGLQVMGLFTSVRAGAR